MGAIAMTGFFLLSGYVLNLTYGRKNLVCPSELKLFYLKRLISIIPLYFVWATIMVIVNVVFNGKSALIEEGILFPIELFGIQSTFSSLFSFSHNGGSWFISCILICYFLYPLIQIITATISNKTRILLVVVLSAILLWSPIVQHYFDLQKIYTNPFFRALEFSIGILVSQLNVSSRASKIFLFLRKPFICLVSFVSLIVGVTIAKKINIPSDYMLYNWVALPCYISLMVSLGSYQFANLQNSRTIKYLSELSFCIFLGQIIYVWFAVKYALDFIGCETNIVKIIVSFMVVFAIANILHFFVEVPSAKYLKQKFLTNK